MLFLILETILLIILKLSGVDSNLVPALAGSVITLDCMFVIGLLFDDDNNNNNSNNRNRERK